MSVLAVLAVLLKSDSSILVRYLGFSTLLVELIFTVRRKYIITIT